MKLLALIGGLLASVLAWAAAYFMIDLQAAYTALWPENNSQQLLGLVTWHAIVGSALAGGLLTIFAPLLGGFLLAFAAIAWGVLGTRLSVGFDIQILVPLILSALGALAALGAAINGMMRRREARRPMSVEEAAREAALRMEPSVDLRHPVKGEFAAAVQEPDPDDDQDFEAEPGFGETADWDRVSPGRRPAGGTGLAVLNAALLIVLTLAVGLLLFSEYSSGALHAAFGLGDPARPVESAPAESSVPENLPAPLEAMATPALPVVPTEVHVTKTPIEFALTGEKTWTDPFAYCAFMGTLDAPDRRYIGPNLVAAIAEALDVPQSAPPDRARWRCVGGGVVACQSFEWPQCAPAPTVAEMEAYCVVHPGAQGLQGPSGRWNCDGIQPDILSGDAWPVDERGFLPRAWVAVPQPAGQPATAG